MLKSYFVSTVDVVFNVKPVNYNKSVRAVLQNLKTILFCEKVLCLCFHQKTV